jgi:hypothetical protein
LVEVGDAERNALHAHLQTYSAPDDALEAIRAWERDENRSLLSAWPADAQLDAALALFRGEKPTQWLARAK